MEGGLLRALNAEREGIGEIPRVSPELIAEARGRGRKGRTGE